MTLRGPHISYEPVAALKRYKLVAFDVDGTLVGNRSQKVVWELFNRHFCDNEAINQTRLKAYLAQEITYARWVELDVSDWIAVGATRSEMERVIRQHLYLMPGAKETVERLRGAGYRLAVISGTLDLTLSLLFPEHPFEEVFTNRLCFDAQGRVSGWEATPFDMEGKADALVEIAARMKIDLDATVFVGDHINDTHVMRRAGLAIAFQPKRDEVREVADHEVDDLREVARLLIDELGSER
ncbi:MAG: HAD family phosphatase [Deltaproteobacteria bacterium]|nr:HAD family phosphatase [Deltaproteobacteria bacterium]